MRKILAALIFLASPAMALELRIRLDKNKAQIGEPITLEIIVEGSGNFGEPKIGIPSELSVYSQSKSQQMNITNWQTSSSVIYTLTLMPNKAGDYTLGPAVIDAGGQMITSGKTTVLITDQKSTQITNTPQGVLRPFTQPQFRRSVDEMRGKNRQSAPQQQQQPKQAAPSKGTPAPQAQTQQATRDEAPMTFIEARVDKKKAFIGEPVRYSVLFYTRVPFLSQPQYKAPGTNGFWHEDLPQRTYNASANGVNYYVTEIPMVLFPSAAGKLEVGQAQITVELENGSLNDPLDPFDPQFFQKFFNAGVGSTQTLISKKTAIEAVPLPTTGRPSDFSGAVGQYEISTVIDKKEIKVGDTATLTVTISGTGNIKSLPSPVYPNLEGTFRSYETEKTENISKDGGQIKGSKTYKLLLIPQVPGQPNLTIPPVRFTYFDPATQKYERKETASISLKVTGEAMAHSSNSAGSPQGGEPKSAKRLTDDIRYIQVEVPGPGPLKALSEAAYRFWAPLAALPAALWASTLLFAFARKRREIAGKNPLRRLQNTISQARQIKTGSVAEVVNKIAPALEAAIVQIIRPHAKTGLTAKNVLEYAEREGTGPLTGEDAALLKKFLSDLHFLRYAPAGEGEAGEVIEDVLSRAEEARKILESL